MNRNTVLWVGGAIALFLLLRSNAAKAASGGKIIMPSAPPAGLMPPSSGNSGGLLVNTRPPVANGGSGQFNTGGDVWCDGCATQAPSTLVRPPVTPRPDDLLIAPPTPDWAFPGEPVAPPPPLWVAPPVAPPIAPPVAPPIAPPIAPPVAPPLTPLVSPPVRPAAQPEVYIVPSMGPVTYNNATNSLEVIPPPSGQRWVTSTENGVTDVWLAPADSIYAGN